MCTFHCKRYPFLCFGWFFEPAAVQASNFLASCSSNTWKMAPHLLQFPAVLFPSACPWIRWVCDVMDSLLGQAHGRRLIQTSGKSYHHYLVRQCVCKSASVGKVLVGMCTRQKENSKHGLLSELGDHFWHLGKAPQQQNSERSQWFQIDPYC